MGIGIGLRKHIRAGMGSEGRCKISQVYNAIYGPNSGKECQMGLDDERNRKQEGPPIRS